MKPLVAVATSTLLALSGVIACAPLSKDQCQAANWQQIGYQNGLKGRDAARFEEERRACAEHGLGADATGWKLGYAQGLGLYCRPEHGYDIGRRGESYGDVCPPDLDAQFRPAYEDGRQIAAIVSALDQRRTQRNDIAQRLAEDDRRARDYVEQIREGRKPPPEPPQLLELHLPVGYAEFLTFAVIMDKVDHGRVLMVERIAPDSNKELLLSVNSSALGPGEYRLRLQGYTWRGERIDVGWVRLKVAAPNP